MTIDERALDLGFQEYDRVMALPEMTELEAFRKAIEAYEAARWRPIEGLPVNVSFMGPISGGDMYVSFMTENGEVFQKLMPPLQK